MSDNLIETHRPPAQSLPNGLRPEFDVWATNKKTVLSVKWLGDGHYRVTDPNGEYGTFSTAALTDYLHKGVYATLPANHDQA